MGYFLPLFSSKGDRKGFRRVLGIGGELQVETCVVLNSVPSFQETNLSDR